LVRRRILAVFCIAWLPLLLLSALGGHALDRGIEMAFLYDIEGHVRLLVALPLLIGTEVYVHLSLRPVVAQFVERNLIVPEDVPKFHAAIDSTTRWRNSVPVELALVAFVYTVGLWVWRNQIAIGTTSWYALPEGTGMRLTAAGYWYVFVSVPIFHFILLRWYLRGFLWLRFLWQVSRLNLRLVPTHPDRTGGLGFLVRSTEAFTPILLAQGVMLAGLIASRIFHAGQELKEFKAQPPSSRSSSSPRSSRSRSNSRARSAGARVSWASSPAVMPARSRRSGCSATRHRTTSSSAAATSSRSLTSEPATAPCWRCASCRSD
jgi:hypothetical protein